MYEKNNNWQNLIQLGYAKLIDVVRGQNAKYGSPNTGKADFVNFEVVNVSTHQPLAPAVKCSFYYTEDAANKPYCAAFYDMICAAEKGGNSGIFTGLNYNVSGNGKMFLVPGFNTKAI